MATHNKTLHLIASKLGLGDEEKVLRKAAEFDRLLQTKTIAGSNMTDTSKVVICLDLASYVLGVDLDNKMAIKYAALKPTMYINYRKVVENLLELNSDKMTVSGLCVTLQCSGVQALAERILEEYQKQAKVEIDLSLPQYVCMAVHHACRINKVKVSKSKVIEKSRLKPTQWAKLDSDWTKFVDENFAAAKRKRGRPVKNVVANDEELNTDYETIKKEEQVPEPQLEPYEDWKKRMLEAAYKELRELEAAENNKDKMDDDKPLSPRKNKRNISPRQDPPFKSPRKNPQLLSPRKSTQLLSPGKDAHPASPRKGPQPLSPRKDVPLLSFRKDAQLLSPRKGTQLLSPKKDAQLLSPKKGTQLLSPRKDVPLLSFRKNAPRLSPRKGTQLLSPRKDVPILSFRKDTKLLSPTREIRLSVKEDMQVLLDRRDSLLSQRKDIQLMSPSNECLSPRRSSPRKTPQKFSPYKPPPQKNGVRLLFPKDL